MDSDMQVRAEIARHFEMMKDPRRKDGFKDIPKLAQYWKALKFEMIPWRTIDLTPGLCHQGDEQMRQ